MERTVRKLKSLLLGTAGAVFIITSASGVMAADLDGDNTEYVEACKTSGFWNLPGMDICFKVGGYVKADVIASFGDIGSGAEFQTGVRTNLINQANNTRLSDGDRIAFHARQSRLNFDARSDTPYGRLRGYVEVDFFDASPDGTGTESLTNSHLVRLRHAYVQFSNLLVGQTWSTFMNTSAAFSDALDFSTTGRTFIRQAQVRWTQPLSDGLSLALAVENPETIFPFRAGAGGVGLNGKDVEQVPDVVAALKLKQKWGNVMVAGVGRQIRVIDNDGGVNGSDEAFGWAASLSGRIKVPVANSKDHIRFYGVYSDGGGRYMLGANQTVGDAYDPDPTTAGTVDLFKSWHVSASFHHWWNKNWRSRILGGMSHNDIPVSIANITPGLIEKTTYASANLIWSPYPRLDIGIEGIYAKAESIGNAVDPGLEEDVVRLQFSVKRSF